MNSPIIRPAFSNLGVPIGRQVSSRLPWWASTKARITYENCGTGLEIPLYGQVERELFVRNQFSWPLHIDEIRMWSNPIRLWYLTRTGYSLSMKKTAFKFKTSNGGYINSLWLPGMAFNTEPDRYLFGYQGAIVYTLPADLYLSHGVTPLVEIIAIQSDMNSRYIQTSMRGYDPTNNKPIVINGRLDAVGTAGANTAVFAYDCERDQAIRDMWVHDFTFAMVSTTSNGSTRNPWLNISARFHMPEGPHWTMDEHTPLIALADQVQAFNMGHEINEADPQQETAETYYVDQPVIHKPVTPYVLLPGDMMTAEIKLLDNTFWTLEPQDLEAEFAGEVIDVWVHFRGYQEGSHVD